MFKRVVFSLIGIFLLIAFVLKINGVEKLEFSDAYFKFISSVNSKFVEWKDFKIPTIEPLNYPSEPGFIGVILTGVIWIVNSLFTLINGLIYVLNLVVSLFKFAAAVIDILTVDSAILVS